MSVTLRDIAQAVGVTEATVSNAINHRGKMSEATRQRILTAVEQMNYTPNTNARNLAVHRSRTIGVVVPNLANPFYGTLVRQIVSLCEANGYHSLLADSFESIDGERRAIQRMVCERIEGLLIVPTNYTQPNADFIPLLDRNGIRYCFLVNRIPDAPHPFVMTDLIHGGEALADHLLETGCRTLVLLAGRERNPTALDRIEGARRAFLHRGLPFPEDSVIHCDAYDFDTACAVTQRLLKSGRKMDAIVAVNDYMASGVLTTLLRSGVAVPDEISVAGYDDLFFTKILSLPLTTVRQNIDAICSEGMRVLLSLLRGESPSQTQIYLPPELVLRSTTRPSPSAP